MSDDFLMKPYSVKIEDFPEYEAIATSPGKARADAWRNYTVICDCNFRDFLRISRVRRSGRFGDATFGAKITVGGRRAYRCGEYGQYVRFVRPGETMTMLSHPLDVEEGWLPNAQ